MKLCKLIECDGCRCCKGVDIPAAPTMTDTVKEAKDPCKDCDNSNCARHINPCMERLAWAHENVDLVIAEVEEAKKLLLSAWHLLDIAEPNAKITEELEQYLRKNLK